MQLAECFYSVQCEGVSTGIPSVFIRFANCNLECGSTKEALKEDADVGQLVKSGEAIWFCDSILVWRKGIKTSNQELLDKMEGFGWDIYQRILKGKIHIIWTGGEPTLSRNEKDIVSFIDFVMNSCIPSRDDTSWLYPKLYSEIETNGTIVTPSGFYQSYIQQINCSPKLSNSGMSKERRINKEALLQIKQHPNSWFKFVVSSEEDIREIQEDFLVPFLIPEEKVILMPAVDKQEDCPKTARFVFEMAKKYGYRAILRSHIVAWDLTTGV